MRLIVVDSITNPFRELDTTDTEDSALRSLLLYQIASTLKEAAHRRVLRAPARVLLGANAFVRRFPLAVVLVNHIVDCYEDNASLIAMSMLEQVLAAVRCVASHFMQPR